MRGYLAVGLLAVTLLGAGARPAAAVRRVVRVYNPFVQPRRNNNFRQARGRNPVQNRNPVLRGNRANRNTTARGAQQRAPLSDFDLQTEVQALKDRHPALTANLPVELRRLDRDTGPLLERMPLLVQDVYYRTVEDYPSLSPDDQRRLGDTLRGLHSVSAVDQTTLVNEAAKEFGPIQADASQRKDALNRSHQTLFRLQDVMKRLGKPAGSS